MFRFILQSNRPHIMAAAFTEFLRQQLYLSILSEYIIFIVAQTNKKWYKGSELFLKIPLEVYYMLFRRNKKLPCIAFPCWPLPIFMSVFCEALLFIWTKDEFVFGRFLAILAFALGFGAVLSLICSLLPAKAGKWTAFSLSILLIVIFIAEYIIDDAFQNFMGIGTIQAGAGGVMTDYFSVVVSAVLSNLWRILLLALPVILFAVFAKPVKSDRNARVALAFLLVIFYLSGVCLVYTIGLDSHKLKEGYNFDSAVRAFGLTTGFYLDIINTTGVAEDDLSFDIVTTPVTQQPAAPATLPQQEAPKPEAAGDPDAAVSEEIPVEEPVEEPVVYYPHAYDLDYATLAVETADSNVAALHTYVSSLTPAMENEFTGLFEGKNLIMITAEAFTDEVIDPELTPTLYRLATEGINFTNYYQPVWGAGTTGGEYSWLVGQIPVSGDCMMDEAVNQDLFLTIGNQLQDQGYHTAAYHNNSHDYYNRHITHPRLGYDYFMGYGNGMEEGITYCWPQSDEEMFQYTIPMYIDKQPFSVYYMTVSAHANYGQGCNDMSEKNYHLVEHLDCTETLKCYYAANMEVELALTHLMDQLEQADILDDTVIVLTSDHYPYGLSPSATWGTSYDFLYELYGTTATEKVRDNNALIIWSSCLEDMDIVVDDPVYSLDILPTLSNLFGVSYDSRMFIGRDVFSEESPLVIWGVSGSWMTELGYYNAERGLFTPNEGVEVPEGYVDTMKAIVSNKIKFSKGTARHNYFNVILEALSPTD